MNTQTKILPKILTFSEIKYYIFSAVFTASAVFFPWLAHQFNFAGPAYLPMQYFVLIAGLLFGWRAGLMIGFASPLLSFGITHMPPSIILVETIIELAVYGFVSGMLREKGLGILTSLFSAMVLGRLARIVYIMVLGSKMNAFVFIQMSLVGIALQIALIPIIIYFFNKFVAAKKV